MKSGTRIKVVAFALMTVFLASVAVASFASAADSNAAGQGVYLTYAINGYGSNTQTLYTSGYSVILSIVTPNCGYGAWYQVSCDTETYFNAVQGVMIGIGVDNPTTIWAGSRRWVGGPPTEAYMPAHTERMFYLPAGTHQFYFLARIYGTTGTGYCYHRSMTVTFFTDAGFE